MLKSDKLETLLLLVEFGKCVFSTSNCILYDHISFAVDLTSIKEDLNIMHDVMLSVSREEYRHDLLSLYEMLGVHTLQPHHIVHKHIVPILQRSTQELLKVPFSLSNDQLLKNKRNLSCSNAIVLTLRHSESLVIYDLLILV